MAPPTPAHRSTAPPPSRSTANTTSPRCPSNQQDDCRRPVAQEVHGDDVKTPSHAPQDDDCDGPRPFIRSTHRTAHLVYQPPYASPHRDAPVAPAKHAKGTEPRVDDHADETRCSGRPGPWRPPRRDLW
ncbi:hypothetical protein Arub01_27510 [Actinomadura rubrobrunea]|uniref:Uncharacterized protein n=1 Tax=Actinomadura rubrobrunea TaxID=115335 RepID=A0A9W6PVP3_9ACTN|nr:hypothetical protein Arub01_27510 [Actinomadura rubrobrunea]